MSNNNIQGKQKDGSWELIKAFLFGNTVKEAQAEKQVSPGSGVGIGILRGIGQVLLWFLSSPIRLFVAVVLGFVLYQALIVLITPYVPAQLQPQNLIGFNAWTTIQPTDSSGKAWQVISTKTETGGSFDYSYYDYEKQERIYVTTTMLHDGQQVTMLDGSTRIFMSSPNGFTFQ